MYLSPEGVAYISRALAENDHVPLVNRNAYGISKSYTPLSQGFPVDEGRAAVEAV